VERIAVRVPDLELARQRAEQRIVPGPVKKLNAREAELRLRRGSDVRARRLRQQLPAEADAERRHALLQESAHELVLAPKPRMLVLLVDVHGASEDEDGVVIAQRPRRIGTLDDPPLVELVTVAAHDIVEHLAAHLVAVHHGEQPHQNSVASAGSGSTAPFAGTPASSSSPRSTCALRGA
jgi:hypothetical protein